MNQEQIFKVNLKFDRTIKLFIKTLATTSQQGTLDSYKNTLKKFIKYITTQYPEINKLSDLKRSPHIENWLSYFAASGVSKGTRKLQLVCIRRFLNLIYEWGWEDAPEPGLITSKDFPRVDRYLPKPISPEMDKKLMDYLRSRNTLMEQALLLLRKTGMRIGELMDLEMNCVEKLPEGGFVLHVPVGKLHTERIIPVDEETAEIVDILKELREYYLPLANPKTGNPTQFLLVRSNWRRPSYAGLRAALVSAGIKSGLESLVTPHMLRHTYATELVRGGINLPALMKLLGHKNIAMTLRYTGVSQPDLQIAYYNAIKQSNSTQILLEHNKNPLTNSQGTVEPNNITEEINNMITKMQSLHQDSKDDKNKKKIQRITERLRRVQKDIENTIK